MRNHRDVTSPSNLADAIRKRRILRGFTQLRLAEVSGTSRVFVSDVERGLSSPTVRMLERIAGALGCQAWELLKDREES